MIHYGKAPNEDKIVIIVSGDDLLHLENVLQAMPLPERRVFHGVKELLETDSSLRKYIDPLMADKAVISRSSGKEVSHAAM